MVDIRPIGYVIGCLVALLGLTMVVPTAFDLMAGDLNWRAFAISAMITSLIGAMIALACANLDETPMTVQQIILLTILVWSLLPVFGAIPFLLGATKLSAVDAIFEAMSGMTTTGATVLSELETLPRGILLWRGLLQWLGGVGIIVVAMVFLPELRVGGMQIFRTEAFDTFGKILPRATEIASRISVIYVGLTSLCVIGYWGSGMGIFDALVHAMTTISTGGLGNYDTSFAAFTPMTQYLAVIFMCLAALPFARYVQLTAGLTRPLFADSQIKTFFLVIICVVIVLCVSEVIRLDRFDEEVLRKTLFNAVSIITGTGYASADYTIWGPFAVSLFFFIGLIGGCAGSTACSVKVFRYQLLFASISTQLRQIRSPNGVFTPRYEGRVIDADVFSSVMSFFVLFVMSLMIISVLLVITGLDTLTAVSGAASALANIGPGLGDIIGPSGNYASLSDVAKWILIIAMLIGRLELMVVFAILTRRFWQS